jgi:putative pyruvate formate lyase activating enzyme
MEELHISGSRGFATTFFQINCTLNCIFCQNYPISQLGNGRKINHDDLVDTCLIFKKEEFITHKLCYIDQLDH